MTTSIKDLETQITELRAALAVASGAVPDTTTDTVTEDTAPPVGTKLHVLKALAIGGEVRRRGNVFEVTEELRAGTVDRNGRSSLNGLIEAGVLALEWPTGEPVWSEPGDETWTYLRTRDLAAADRIAHPAERSDAIARVHRTYGPAPEGWREPPKQHRSKWAV